MKKIIFSLIFTTVIASVLIVSVSSAESYQGKGEIDDIYDYFMNDAGWPDYVSFAYNYAAETSAYDPSASDDDQMQITNYWEIGIVDLDDEKKDAILSFMSPSCVVKFTECSHSYAERNAVFKDIVEAVKNDLGVSGVSIMKDSEKIAITVYADALIDSYTEKYTKKFGDIVIISTAGYEDNDDHSYGTPEVGTPEVGYEIGNSSPKSASEYGMYRADHKLELILILAGAAAIIILSVFAVQRKKASLLLAANNGATVASARQSRSEVKKSVKNDVSSPSDEVRDRIFREIK